jgi:hypothetical protein
MKTRMVPEEGSCTRRDVCDVGGAWDTLPTRGVPTLGRNLLSPLRHNINLLLNLVIFE